MSMVWRRWLAVWCGAVAVFGVVLAGAGFEATTGPVRWLFEMMNPAAPPDFTPPMRLATALMGCVTLGWAVTLLVAIAAAQALGARGVGVWRGIVAGVAVWFVIDSAISVETGFALNALSNTIFVAAFLVPILASRVLAGARPLPIEGVAQT